MAQTIDYNRANFLHHEADPTLSRATVLLNAQAKAGDLLVLGSSGYATYTARLRTFYTPLYISQV